MGKSEGFDFQGNYVIQISNILLQTLNNFYFVTIYLSFIQLHISEQSGRGVPKIVAAYGKKAFDFRENSIAVTIPFNRINKTGDNVGDKVGDKAATKIKKHKL